MINWEIATSQDTLDHDERQKSVLGGVGRGAISILFLDLFLWILVLFLVRFSVIPFVAKESRRTGESSEIPD